MPDPISREWKAQPMSPSKLLATIGQALHGERWRRPLADDLGVDERSIRAWLSGKLVLGPDHGIFRNLEDLLVARIGEMSRALDALRGRVEGPR